MEIFHQCLQYTPSNLSDFIECSSYYNLCNTFCRYMFKTEVIDRYMHCILQNLKKNAQFVGFDETFIDCAV